MNQLKKTAGAGRALLTMLCLMTLCVMACENPSGGGGGGGGLAAAGALWTPSLNGVNVPFRYVPAGSFQRDGTATNVSVITRGYWMSETEVTQELFQAVMGTKPSYFDGSSGDTPAKDTPTGEVQNRRPVERVSWFHAIAFCNKLSIANGKEPVYSVSGVSDWVGLAYGSIPTTWYPGHPGEPGDWDWDAWSAAAWDKTKNGYRLPTEMEWMWAAMGADTSVQPNRTGYTKAFAGSTGSNSIGDYAWYDTNSDSTHEVGKKSANELGLRDMSGNVREWCWDWESDFYLTGKKTNYDGAVSGMSRVERGGGWISDTSDCAVSYRGEDGADPEITRHNLGFRVVCP
jgi:formylglycine-generating enzyme required for sulfatase activity